MEWLNKIIQVFRIRELRNKILFVLGVFVVFRLMSTIPMPGVDIENLRGFLGQFQVLGLLNVFSGGVMEKTGKADGILL